MSQTSPCALRKPLNMDLHACRNVLRMVSELHLRGCQRIRIMPGMSASGIHWRCSVSSLPPDPAISLEGAQVARYGSGMEQEYFGWKDAAHRTTSQLADLFLQRFPEIAQAGFGSDWAYTGWYVEMLHLTYPDALPIAYADWELPEDHWTTIGKGLPRHIPLPPPG